MNKDQGSNEEKKPLSLWLMVILFVVLGTVIIIAGIYYNRKYQETVLNERNIILNTIAENKSEAVNNWITTVIEKSKFMQDNVLLAREINEFFSGRNTENTRKELLGYFPSIARLLNAEQLFLIDPEGETRLTMNPDDTLSYRNIKNEKNLHRVSYTVYFRSKTFDRMTVRIPIYKDNNPQKNILAFLVLGYNLNKSLYPSIDDLSSGTSAETLIILREHDTITYLNDQKYIIESDKGRRSSSALPLTPFKNILNNKEGFVEGIDYRGERVLAVVKKIPGIIPWYIVTKIDRKEVLEAIRQDTMSVTLIISLLIFGVLGALGSIVWTQRMKYYHRLYQAEKEKRLLTEHFEYILKYANDLIFLIDKDLNILEINDKVVETYGFQRRELIGTPIIMLRPPAEQDKLKTQYNDLVENSSLTYQTIHIKKDGTQFPVEMSVRLVVSDGETFIQSIGRDITERKKHEDVLNNLVLRYNVALSAASMGVWNWDFINHKLVWDNNIEAIYGQKSDDTADGENTWLSILHPDDRERARQRAKAAIGDTEDYNDEYRIIHSDGKEIYVKSYGRVLRDSANKPVSMSGVSFDISAQKHAMDLLKERDFWLTESQKMGSIGSFSLNVKNSSLTVSVVLADILGLGNESEITLQRLYSIIHPDSKELMAEYFNDIVTNRKDTFDKEFKITRPETNETRWILGRAGLSTSGDSETLLMIGTMQDITERKEAEEALRKSNNRINTIINNLKGVIFSCANDDDRTMKYISDGIFELTGYEPDEFIANSKRTFNSVIFPADQKRVRDDIQEALRKDSTYAVEYRTTTPTGAVKWVWERGRGYFEGSEIKTIEGFLADITDRKFVEEELIKAKEKAEESDRLKTAFLHNISHEIRTPMNAIVGFTTLLDTPELTDEMKRQYMDIIFQSSNQLLSIITDIVDISNIEIGHVKVSAGVVNINALLKNLFEQFNLRAKQQGVHLSYDMSLTDESSTVVTDSTKLIQILTNLINNALKFTPGGSIEYGYVHRDTDLEFFVKDTGIGIEKEKHERIFERFYQIENVYTKQFSGTGLGLAISKAYVELLGGKIWLESEIGKGSSFYFTIPHDSPVNRKIIRKPNKTIEKKMTMMSGKTILVAEDDRINFLLIREILTKAGVNILWAANGEEAVDICRNNDKIDLILMDIKMPLMDGYEATKVIRGFRPTLPVVALTAYAQASDRDRALAEGCVGHISKPVDRTQLYNVIEQFL